MSHITELAQLLTAPEASLETEDDLFAINELYLEKGWALNPWQPLHVERGFARAASCVTVIGAECPHHVNDHESISGVGILKTIAATLIATGMHDVYVSI